MKNKQEPKETISVYDLFREQRRREKKRLRKEYWEEHRFEIIHVILSSVAIVISIIALIVSIVAL